MRNMKSLVSDKKLTNAVGGKCARACDNCIKKRARWYCAADDAFLCQSCDSSVHFANTLARRHERVRLKTTSSINSLDDESRTRLQISVPSWHQGFTRKARTPRQKRHGKFKSVSGININVPPLHLVPEIGSEEYSHDENDEQLLYRVPIFDPFVAELCNSTNSNQAEEKGFRRDVVQNAQTFGDEPKATSYEFTQETNHLQGFLPSEMDLAEFAADVESLLGKGLEDESFDMEGLGILDCQIKPRDGKEYSNSYRSERVKIEEEEVGEVTVSQENRGTEIDLNLGRESFELNFDYDSPIPHEEEEDCKEQVNNNSGGDPTVRNKVGEDSGKTFLSLDYEAVMSSWGDQNSPWTTGRRPELNSGDLWATNLGGGMAAVYGEMGIMNGTAAMVDGDREARVSRYREKRRTRLFAKKIRYEVRKLNAEKRPRMKGRFVKRASLQGAPAFPPLMNNN